MNKINLHYAHLDLKSDIPVFQFDTILELEEYLFQSIYEEVDDWFNLDFVILLSFNEQVIVTDDLNVIFDLFQMLPHHPKTIQSASDLFLQEYESFKDAYEVALMMKEGHKLCYNDKHLNN